MIIFLTLKNLEQITQHGAHIIIILSYYQQHNKTQICNENNDYLSTQNNEYLTDRKLLYEHIHNF